MLWITQRSRAGHCCLPAALPPAHGWWPPGPGSGHRPESPGTCHLAGWLPQLRALQGCPRDWGSRTPPPPQGHQAASWAVPAAPLRVIKAGAEWASAAQPWGRARPSAQVSSRSAVRGPASAQLRQPLPAESPASRHLRVLVLLICFQTAAAGAAPRSTHLLPSATPTWASRGHSSSAASSREPSWPLGPPILFPLGWTMLLFSEARWARGPPVPCQASARLDTNLPLHGGPGNWGLRFPPDGVDGGPGRPQARVDPPASAPGPVVPPAASAGSR